MASRAAPRSASAKPAQVMAKSDPQLPSNFVPKLPAVKPWRFDDDGKSERLEESLSPHGWGTKEIAAAAETRIDDLQRRHMAYQSAMAVAYGPGRGLLSTGFMLYMSGSSLQIFSIIALAMAFMQPITGLMNTRAVFKRFEDAKISLLIPTLTYIVLCFVALAVAIYKAQVMGLMPSMSELFASHPQVRVPLEITSGSLFV